MKNYLNYLYVQLITSIDKLKNEKGQGLVEYALILVLIAVVVIAAVTNIGKGANNTFTNIATTLNK